MSPDDLGLGSALGVVFQSAPRRELGPSPWRAQLEARAALLGLRIARRKGGWQVGSAWTNNLSGVEDLLVDLEAEQAKAKRNKEEQLRYAYTAVVEADGYGIGRADEGTKGYSPCPEHGRFASWEEASGHAAQLNAALGLDPAEATKMVLETMR